MANPRADFARGVAEGTAGRADVIHRVRGIVRGLNLDCECREKLDGALHRFEVLEEKRQVRRLILDARQQADRIAALLDFVQELNEVTTDEPDASVFGEIASLFEEIKEAAARAERDLDAIREFRSPAGDSDP